MGTWNVATTSRCRPRTTTTTTTTTEYAHFVGQDVDGDGGADDLLHVRADDGHLGHDPDDEARRPVVLSVALLGQVQARHHAQPGGQPLHEQAQNGRRHQQPQQLKNKTPVRYHRSHVKADQ